MEGPSLVILSQELQPFVGQKVLSVRGNSKQPIQTLKQRKLVEVMTWGKNLFMRFSQPPRSDILTKTHFMMFGSYRINEPKENRDPRLELKFKNGSVYFYSCSLRFDAEEYWLSRDRAVDVMSPEWDRQHVVELMAKKKNALLCDLLLDQEIFAGSGNIVKNEVLFNIRRHPLTRLAQVGKADRLKLAEGVRSYCKHFYEWKMSFELRRHWQVYRQHRCPLCQRKLTRENNGKFHRRSFFCAHHQPLRKSKRRLVVHDVLPPAKPFTAKEGRLDH